MNILEQIRSYPGLSDLLDTLCDFRLADEAAAPDEISVRTDVPFEIFGKDAAGGKFGFINGSNAVGYIGSEGQAGKIADSLKDFFNLIVFFPYWHELLHMTENEYADDIEEDFKEMINELGVEYDETQAEIAAILSLKRDPGAVDKLHNIIRANAGFKAYSCDGSEYEPLISD